MNTHTTYSVHFPTVIDSRGEKQRARQPCWLFYPDDDDADDNDDDVDDDDDDKWSETGCFLSVILKNELHGFR